MSALVLLARRPARFDRAARCFARAPEGALRRFARAPEGALRPALAAALGLATLAASACVDEVVVGTQPSPIAVLDAGHDAGDDASQPGPDAGGAPDAQPAPEPDAALDAAPPPQDTGTPDSSPPLPDAAPDDGGPVVVLSGDAALDAARLGPCSCGAMIAVSPDALIDTCPGEKVCWENPDDTCAVQCPPTEPCRASSECAPDEYCYFAESDCGEGSRGWCAPRPLGDCSQIGNPACGCDGVIYEKRCFALQAGVDVAGSASDPRCAQSP
jgi:hypothetical protein